MDVTTILIIVIAVIVLALIAAVAMRGKQRSELKSKFGPEYERTVDQRDDRREAEAELREREKRRNQLDIRPLSDGDRTKFVAEWDRVEARFVEDPDGAAREGDRIVADVMRQRGYPVEGRDHTDVLSVDHPDLVDRYREALRTTPTPGRRRPRSSARPCSTCGRPSRSSRTAAARTTTTRRPDDEPRRPDRTP
jgi:hypothetical protein